MAVGAGGQMWYLQDRAKDAIKADKEIAVSLAARRARAEWSESRMERRKGGCGAVLRGVTMPGRVSMKRKRGVGNGQTRADGQAETMAPPGAGQHIRAQRRCHFDFSLIFAFSGTQGEPFNQKAKDAG